MTDDLVCPNCGYTAGFDVYSAKGDDDPHVWIHCPNCNHIWQPNPPKVENWEIKRRQILDGN